MLCLTYTAKVQNQHRNEQTFRHSNSYACRSNRKKKITKKSVKTLGHVLEDMYTKRMVYSSTYLQSSL